ncbi:MAG: glycosyltransferase [Kiritimatiellia bacterium]
MSKSLLYLASTWPEPASSAAGTRSLQRLDLFTELGWKIRLMSAASPRPYSARLPDSVATGTLHLNDSRMDAVFKELQPDLVLFDRFMTEEQYGWRISRCCPQALRILDTVDLHSLREIRRKALLQERERSPSDWFCNIALREIASIYRSDLTLLLSDAEVEILSGELAVPASLLFRLPFLLLDSELHLPASLPGFADRRDFAHIGNFRHPPNADAVHVLKSTLWPKLRAACPGTHLHLYGADLTPALQSLHIPEHGFHICGRADDAGEVMRRARVCLAPLRFGAGLKGKLLDAMRAGTPSVTTPIGAEGMQGPFPWPGAVESDPEAWVRAAAELYQQAPAWQSAQQKIPALLSGRFARSAFSGPLEKKIASLLSESARLTPERFTGALLRHHQHRSTEYMSRWIEAKNRRPD